MSESLRIIQVVNVRWFNATAWYALFLSRLLQEAGHQVIVLGLEGTASFAKAVEWGLDVRGINLNTVHPVNFWHEAKKAARLVQEFRPDIVNCHRGEGFFLWGLLRDQQHPFSLVRTRGDQRSPKNSMVNRFVHQRLADKLIATNSVTAMEFVRTLKCPESHVRTVLGGVDTEVFRYDALGRERVRSELGILPDELVIGFLGRLDPVKGPQELLEALGSLYRGDGPLGKRQGVTPFRILLAGFPSIISEKTLAKWVSEHGLDGRVILTGRRPDVAACISAMDMAVIASQGSEAIARAAFEIMSCGVPLFGTRVGVMPDLLPHWALVPPADPEALQAIIERALTDAAWRAELREECLKRIATLSEQDFVKETLRAYQCAMRNRHKEKRGVALGI